MGDTDSRAIEADRRRLLKINLKTPQLA